MTEAASLVGVIKLVGLPEATRGLKAFGKDVDVAQGKLDGTGKSVDQFGRRMSDTGKQLTRNVSVPLLGLGIAAGKVGADFSAQMSKVSAKSGATGADLDKLRKQAMKLGAETSFSATKAAEGMEVLAAAGLKPHEIMKAMPGLLDAAAASGEGLAATSDVVANALAQFGLEADQTTRIADVLAKASNETQGSIGSMGEALKYAGTGANELGFDLEETTGMLSRMVKAGIDGGQAGTSLRMGLQRTALGANASRVALKKLADISPELANIWKSAEPVPEKLDDMSVAFEKLDGTTRVNAANLIFGTEAATGMLQVMKGGPAEIDKWTASMRNSTGEAKKMADVNLDNLSGDVEALGGAFESAFIGLFNQAEGPMRGITQMVTGMVTGFSNLNPALQQTAIGAGLVAAGIGPMMMAVSPMLTVFGGGVTAVTALGTGIGTLGMAAGTAAPSLATLGLLAAANPLLTGAVAVGGIVAAGIAIANMGGSADTLGVSAKTAADRVKGLDDAAKSLAGVNLSQREAELQQTVTTRELAAARQHLQALEKSGTASKKEIAAAALAVEQAETRSERATLSAKDARKANNDMLREARSAAQRNIDTITREEAKQRDLARQYDQLAEHAGRMDQAGASAREGIRQINEELEASRGKAEGARAAIERAGVSIRDLGPKAAGSKKVLREISNLLAGLPRDVKVNVTAMYREVNKPRQFGTYAPNAPLRNADGGIISGPGTGTSDSILSWVSNGEAIVPAESTSRNRKLLEWMIDNPHEQVGIPGFAKGKKPKVTRKTAEKKMATLQDKQGLTSAKNDAALAKAEATARTADDIERWDKIRKDAGTAIRVWERFVKSAEYRKLSASGKSSAQSQLASARREQQRAKEELERLRTPAEGAGGADGTAGTDPAAEAAAQAAREAERQRIEMERADLAARLDQQVRRAGIAAEEARLANAALRTFGGTNDIGHSGGANAYDAARGMQPVNVHVHSLTGYSPEIRQVVGDAASGGFTQGGNASRSYSGRI